MESESHFPLLDPSSHACPSCGASFTPLLKPHSCHLCGVGYCFKCVENSLQQETGEELSRICLQCCRSFTTGKKNEEAADKILVEPESPTSSDMDVGPSFSESIPQEILHIDYTDTQLTFACRRLAAEHGVPSSWIPHIVSLSRKAVNSVFVDKCDVMNVNAYVRVLCVKHKDDALTEYVNGIAFFKNVAHKKMKTHLNNPSVLLLAGGTEFSSGEPQLLSMETVLTEEPDYTKIFLRKLTKLKLSLLIVEGSMSQWVISELSRFGVTVLINVKRTVLNMLARVTQAKILTDLDQAATVKNCVGRCKEVEVRGYKKTGIVVIRTGEEMARGGAVLLSGPDEELLKKVKFVLRQMMVHARNLRLEGSLLSQIGTVQTSPLTEELTAREVTVQYMTTSGKLCTKPHTVSVQLYSSDDTPLGQWISVILSKLNEVCVACGVPEANHREHFLKHDGMLTVRFQHRGKEAYYRESIEVLSECEVCGTKSCPLPLNLWSWELSFYRLVGNFFYRHRTELGGNCKHQLFPRTKVKFTYGMYNIFFEYTSKRVYSLLPLNHTIQLENYYQDLNSRANTETVTFATELYRSLLRELEDIRDRLRTSAMPQSDLSELKAKLSETFLVIASAIEEIENTIVISDLLHVEFLRKRLFLEICAIKITLQAYKLAIKEGSHTKVSQTLEVMDWSSPVAQECPLTPPRYGEDQPTIPSVGPRRRSTNLLRQNKLTLDHHSVIVFPQDWLPLEKTDPLLCSAAFLALQRGSQTLLPGLQSTFTPVQDSDPLSIIAYALNSQKYHEEVYRLFQMNVDVSECIESELLSGSDSSFDLTFHTFDFSEVTGKADLMRIYGPSVTFHVKAFYARQFQAMRLFLNPDIKDFLRSIYKSTAEEQNLGKSGARFFRCHDGKYIAKVVDEKEFQMFADIAPNYFRHVCKSFYHNMPSRIVHIIGVFRYSVKNLTTGHKEITWLLVMRNLSFGISPTAVAYDLKGTANSRRYVKDGEKMTKMDLNFIGDMQGLPLSLSTESKQMLESALWNDTLFLSKQNVIDYSLIVLISEEEGVVAAGVIDYLRQYTFDKAIESKYKKVIANEIPTITNPTQYKERFRQQVLQDYFLAIDSE